MGYVLFTANGTFNPSSYGLVTGDTIQLLVVGGGASGQGVMGRTTPGTNSSGGTSSVGSIVSATGGVASKGCLGFSNYQIGAGGDGQHGCLIPTGLAPWTLMDYVSGYVAAVAASAEPSVYNTTGRVHLAYNGTAAMSSSGSYSARGVYAGRGGLGYGAGGGGAVYMYRSDGGQAGRGGAAGDMKAAVYVLPNANGISVTIGAGGAASSDNYPGGAGAPGCVAVFW